MKTNNPNLINAAFIIFVKYNFDCNLFKISHNNDFFYRILYSTTLKNSIKLSKQIYLVLHQNFNDSTESKILETDYDYNVTGPESNVLF